MHEFIIFENDPGVDPSDLQNPFSGLPAHIQESKSIGTANLSGGVLARDAKVRAVSLPSRTMMRHKIQKAHGASKRRVNTVTQEANSKLTSLLNAYTSDGITFNELRIKSNTVLRDGYEKMRQLGRKAAGIDRLGASQNILREEEKWFRTAVREELRYWDEFLHKLRSGSIDETKIPNRVDNYVEAIRFMFESSRIQALPDNVLIYWTGPKKEDPSICEGCTLMMEWSPFPKEFVPAVPRDGTTPCLHNCRHQIVVRVATFQDVLRRKVQVERIVVGTKRRARSSNPRAKFLQKLKEVKHRRGNKKILSRIKDPFRGEKLPESIEEQTSPRYNFDSAPYSTMDLRDVARILLRSAKSRDAKTLVPVLDRLITALEHTIISVEGRPRGMQVAKMIREAFAELIDALRDLPESVSEKVMRLETLVEDLCP